MLSVHLSLSEPLIVIIIHHIYSLHFCFVSLLVPPSINCRLLAHQRDGVRFLYNLYRNNHGGVLGDDM